MFGLRALALVLVLVSPARAAVSRIFDCQGVDCSTLTCLADDSLTVASGCSVSASGTGTIVATTADALTSNPSDCSANQFANAIAANGDLTCAQVDHGADLSGLTDDDHTQYFLLAGRSGGQSAIGGTASGNDLTLTPNSAAADGAINVEGFTEVFSTAPDISSSSDSWVSFAADLDMAGTLPTLLGIEFAPTVHVGQAAATIPIVTALKGSGTILIDDATATPAAPIYRLFQSTWTNESQVVGVPPFSGQAFVDQTIYNYNAATTTATMSSNAPVSFLAGPTLKTGNTGKLSITSPNLSSFNSAPTVTAAASGTLDITRYTHYLVSGLTQTAGGGTETVTTEIGLHIDTLNADTTNIGIENDYSTVLPPASSGQIITATTTIASATMASVLSVCVSTCADTSSNITWTGTGSTIIDDGSDGQIVIITNADAADQVTLGQGNNVYLCNAANWDLSAGESIMMVYDGQNARWSQICGV